MLGLEVSSTAGAAATDVVLVVRRDHGRAPPGRGDADAGAGQDLSRAALREALTDVELLVTFNDQRFDVPFLESAFGLSIDLPHLDFLYPCRRLGWTGGLQGIERAVGIERERPDLSGRDAVRLWRAYEAGDGGALETLMAYNREDTGHLERLLELVVERLEVEVLRSVVEEVNCAEIIRVTLEHRLCEIRLGAFLVSRQVIQSAGDQTNRIIGLIVSYILI